MILEPGDGYVRLGLGPRAITRGGETRPEGPEGPDFVIHLDTIECWDPPHEHLSLGLDDIRKVTEAAEAAVDARGLTVEFE